MAESQGGEGSTKVSKEKILSLLSTGERSFTYAQARGKGGGSYARSPEEVSGQVPRQSVRELTLARIKQLRTETGNVYSGLTPTQRASLSEGERAALFREQKFKARTSERRSKGIGGYRDTGLRPGQVGQIEVNGTVIPVSGGYRRRLLEVYGSRGQDVIAPEEIIKESPQRISSGRIETIPEGRIGLMTRFGTSLGKLEQQFERSEGLTRYRLGTALFVASTFTYPIQLITQPGKTIKETILFPVKAVTKPAETFGGIGKELRRRPIPFFGEQTGVILTLKGVGKVAGKGATYAEPLTEPFRDFIAREAVVLRLPFEKQKPARVIIKTSQAQRFLDIDRDGPVPFADVKELRGAEPVILEAELKSTKGSGVYGSLVTYYKTGKKSFPPSDVDVFTPKPGQFQAKFTRDVNVQSFIPTAEFKGAKVKRIATGETILDVKPVTRLRQGEKIPILPQYSQTVSLPPLTEGGGILMTTLGEQTLRKGLGTLQVLADIKGGFRRVKDPRAFVQSLELQLLESRSKPVLGSLSKRYRAERIIEKNIPYFRSKEFMNILEKNQPGIKEYPLEKSAVNLADRRPSIGIISGKKGSSSIPSRVPSKRSIESSSIIFFKPPSRTPSSITPSITPPSRLTSSKPPSRLTPSRTPSRIPSNIPLNITTPSRLTPSRPPSRTPSSITPSITPTNKPSPLFPPPKREPPTELQFRFITREGTQPKRQRKLKSPKFKPRYTASVESIVFNIRGKRPGKIATISGLVRRPL